MTFSSWLCTNSTKNMVVKIVHPGGHAELHDRPVVAAEIMLRNPRCVVAHPNVFQQPWAIVAPDSTLQLGKKYYVVPVSTIRKLQRLAFKKSSTSRATEENNQSGGNNTSKDDQEEEDGTNICACCYALKSPYSCVKHSSDDQGGARSNTISDDRRNNDNDVSKDKCFMCLLTRMKIVKGNSGEDSGSSSCTSVTSETRALTARRGINDSTRGLPPRSATLDHWQPNLESITEERSNNYQSDTQS